MVSDLALAHAALDALGVAATDVTVLERTSYNTFARVNSPTGCFALRLDNPTRVHDAEVEHVEAAWLRALPASWGSPRSRGVVDIDGRRCTLFDWIDGVPPQRGLGPDAPEQLALLMARLHEQAAAMRAVPGQDAVRFDTVLTMPRHDLLSAYDPMCAEAIERVQIVIDQLWLDAPHPPHLIHGDIGSHNAIRTADSVVLIDFQDLRLGFDVQDLGRTLADFDRGRPGWSDRFIAAYAAIRPLPELSPTQRSAFRCGRSLDILNLGLHPKRPRFDGTWQRHFPVVAEFMRA